MLAQVGCRCGCRYGGLGLAGSCHGRKETGGRGVATGILRLLIPVRM